MQDNDSNHEKRAPMAAVGGAGLNSEASRGISHIDTDETKILDPRESSQATDARLRRDAGRPGAGYAQTETRPIGSRGSTVAEGGGGGAVEAERRSEQEPRKVVRCSELLAALRLRFPKARFHFEPASDCERCGGSGVEPTRRLSPTKVLNEGPCACLFFGPDTKLGVSLVGAAARRLSAANGESSDSRP